MSRPSTPPTCTARPDRFFLQMRGTALVQQSGYPDARLTGFFESYLDSPPPSGAGGTSP